MNKNTTTEFVFVVNAAREAIKDLNLKGSRSTAGIAFINAESDDDREAVVETFGAGRVRRGLRQLARGQKDADVAGAFWYLRDLIDADGSVLTEDDLLDTDVVEAAA